MLSNRYLYTYLCFLVNGEEKVKCKLVKMKKWGYIAHREWRESCIIGRFTAGKQAEKKYTLYHFGFGNGHNWKGTEFGGWKNRTEDQC